MLSVIGAVLFSITTTWRLSGQVVVHEKQSPTKLQYLDCFGLIFWLDGGNVTLSCRWEQNRKPKRVDFKAVKWSHIYLEKPKFYFGTTMCQFSLGLPVIFGVLVWGIGKTRGKELRPGFEVQTVGS